MLVGNMLVMVDVQYYTQHYGVASIQRLLQGPGFTAKKEYRLHGVQWALRNVFSYDVCVCHLKRKYQLVKS